MTPDKQSMKKAVMPRLRTTVLEFPKRLMLGKLPLVMFVKQRNLFCPGLSCTHVAKLYFYFYTFWCIQCV